MQGDSDVVPDVATIAHRLKANLEKLNLVQITKGSKPQDDEIAQRQEADGFQIEHDWLVKSKKWTISTADGRVLAARNILRTEKRTDSLNVSKKIAGIKKKLRYYVVDAIVLEQVIKESQRTEVTN